LVVEFLILEPLEERREDWLGEEEPGEKVDRMYGLGTNMIMCSVHKQPKLLAINTGPGHRQ
jgi:hypothetical protein